jgi:hypothetical protein
MRHKTRIVTAATALVLLTGAAAGVAAAEAGSSSASPSPATGTSSAKALPDAADANARAKAKAAAQAESLDAIAARLHVTVAQLDQALADAKQYLGTHGLGKPDAAVVALVAKDLGISDGQARSLLDHVFASGPGFKKVPVKPGTPDPQISAALAKVMGISQDRAASILERLDRIDAASGHGVSVTDPAFQALAASLGLSPQQLSNDLVAMKESLRASMPAPSQSPTPSSGQPSEPASGAHSAKG